MGTTTTVLAPALLTMPGYMGTLAAVRCLGEHGVPVTVAGDGLLGPARWSRYASAFVTCPSSREPRRFIEWLLDFGDRHPGYFLYPTSDDLLWLFAHHEDELRKRFLLYQPPRANQFALLDKKQLHAACARAAVDTVESWFPLSEEAVRKLAPALPYPILLKPRTQAMLASWNKGALVSNGDELLESYRSCVERDRYPAEMERDFGSLSAPILQRFCAQAIEGIYSLSGLVDESGDLLGARASVKVLQRPRKIGIGLCFESAPVVPRAAEAVQRLCREAGYFGVFEAEFIVENGRYMLIDFNGRFYGQMEFEHARGLPLAWLAHLGSRGASSEMRACADEAGRAPAQQGGIYCHRFYFEFLLALRRAAFVLAPEEHRRWRDWYAAHRDQAVDASASKTDRLPGLVHIAAELRGAVRSPFGFIRGLRQ